MTIIPEYRGFLLLILPPGGFIMLSLILAGKRVIDTRMAKTDEIDDAVPESGSKEFTI
jgi:electron transport complex protein RnfE